MALGVVFPRNTGNDNWRDYSRCGILGHPGSTLLGVLLGIVVPIHAFIAATYDGSLYALIFVSILVPLVHLVFERQNWIIPPKKSQNI